MKTLQLLRLWRITSQSSIEHPTSSQRSTPYQSRGGSRGRVQGVRTLSPPWDDLRFSNTTGILQKKTMWFIGDEVEQETSAPPPAFSLLPGDGKDEQPKSTGFSNCTACNMSFVFFYLFFAFSGNSLFCWISDSTAKAVAVVTPVCLALAFNAVCLTKSLYGIHRLKKVCHSHNLQAIL